MGCEVAADDRKLAAMKREADGYGAFVAAHAKDTARHRRRRHLAQVTVDDARFIVKTKVRIKAKCVKPRSRPRGAGGAI